jgi:hypothetical protein
MIEPTRGNTTDIFGISASVDMARPTFSKSLYDSSKDSKGDANPNFRSDPMITPSVESPYYEQ